MKFVLQDEIDRLSKLHQATSFLPHITAARLPVKTPDEIVKALDEITERVNNHTISFGNIELGSKPYQKMVVDLNYTRFFSELSEAVDSAFQEPCSKNEFHCSLMYGYTPDNLLENEKIKISERLPEGCIAYELAVVRLNGGPDEWRILHQKKMM